MWHSTSKYRREIWQCGVKYKNIEPCRTPHLYAHDLQQAFLSAFSTLMADREGLLEDCRLMRETLGDCREIDTRLMELDDEALVVAGMIEKLVDENATQALDQADYLDRYQAYEARFLRLQERKEQLSRQRADRVAKDYVISQFMFEIHELGTLPLAFDEKLWLAVVDTVTVHEDERLVFTFRNGAQVTERL